MAGAILYIESLCECLSRRGIEACGVPSPPSLAVFSRILDEQKPDLVHFHYFHPWISVPLLREAKRRGLAAVFTCQSPSVSCRRQTLMRWGREACDGTLDAGLCTRCRLHEKGIPRSLTFLAAKVRRSTRSWVERNHSELRTFLREVDHVVAPSRWVRDLFLRNGVPERKVTLSHGGLLRRPEDRLPVRENRTGLRMVFLGRHHRIKGAHVLIRALRGLNNPRMTLDLFGIYGKGPTAAWLHHLRKLARGDSRIAFHDPVPNKEVIPLLRGFDVMAVPSQWLEVCPHVVQEAFAAGIPVVGSNLGGISELVRHGVDGLLVDRHGSPRAWRQALKRVADEPGLLPRLRSGVRPPRDMEETAGDMARLYERLCAGRRAPIVA